MKIIKIVILTSQLIFWFILEKIFFHLKICFLRICLKFSILFQVQITTIVTKKTKTTFSDHLSKSNTTRNGNLFMENIFHTRKWWKRKARLGKKTTKKGYLSNTCQPEKSSKGNSYFEYKELFYSSLFFSVNESYRVTFWENDRPIFLFTFFFLIVSYFFTNFLSVFLFLYTLTLILLLSRLFSRLDEYKMRVKFCLFYVWSFFPGVVGGFFHFFEEQGWLEKVCFYTFSKIPCSIPMCKTIYYTYLKATEWPLNAAKSFNIYFPPVF